MLRNVWTRYRVISFRHSRKYSSVESEEISTPFFDEYDETSRIHQVPPTGSALFRESEHFTPLVKPDPKFYWDAIQHSLNARGLSDQFNLEQLRDLRRQIEDIHEQIGLVEAKRKEHQKVYEATKQDSEDARLQARRLRTEYQQLKRLARELLPQFLRPALAIPNVLHTDCPVTDKSRLVLQFIQHPVGKAIEWSTVQDDLHITPIGVYLTGQLTHIERTHLNLACERWLHGDFTVPNYLIRLSDIVRGPVVEGSSWFPMDEAIRLEPSHSDLVRIPSESDSVSSSARFLVNPYTSCYLVGSASLPSFVAYLMRQKLKTDTPLPLRLVSLGTFYDRRNSSANTTRRTAVGLHPPRFVQGKQLSVMELSSSWHSCESGFHQLVDDVCRFWANYQPTWPLRLVYVSAKALAPCEMIRAVVELIPNDNDNATQNGRICPIQLASVSLLDDWVSRRVLAKVDRMATDGDQVSSYVRMNYVQVIDFNSLLNAFQQTGTLTVSSL